MAPLLKIDEIKARQQAVEDMINFQHETDVVRVRLKPLHDLERMLAKIFMYSAKHKSKAIYFEDVSLIKLKDFRVLLTDFKKIEFALAPLINQRHCFKSPRLRALLSPNDDEEEEPGLFPGDLMLAIESFEQLIIWKKVGGTDKEIPEPKPGFDADFDSNNEKVNLIKKELDSILMDV
mmetsp:Transcript_21387/g.33077  ORF Transcript_21387/g.33077 Transcript_21387/m.33077 type:complete len:178 (+) Transcript_21387:1863-2396(+)